MSDSSVQVEALEKAIELATVSERALYAAMKRDEDQLNASRSKWHKAYTEIQGMKRQLEVEKAVSERLAEVA